MLTVLAEKVEMFLLLLVCFVPLLRFVSFFPSDLGLVFVPFDYQFLAFLNNHCEHELWKASLHCRQFDIIVFIFFFKKKNFVSDKLPKLYKIFVQKQSITCIKKICMYM